MARLLVKTTAAVFSDFPDGFAGERGRDEKYRCGWDYSLHLGGVGGNTILRYDNAHERTKGHERHTQDGVETIQFPGMLTLYDRFKRETEEMSPVSWNWPE